MRVLVGCACLAVTRQQQTLSTPIFTFASDQLSVKELMVLIVFCADLVGGIRNDSTTEGLSHAHLHFRFRSVKELMILVGCAGLVVK